MISNGKLPPLLANQRNSARMGMVSSLPLCPMAKQASNQTVNL